MKLKNLIELFNLPTEKFKVKINEEDEFFYLYEINDCKTLLNKKSDRYIRSRVVNKFYNKYKNYDIDSIYTGYHSPNGDNEFLDCLCILLKERKD